MLLQDRGKTGIVLGLFKVDKLTATVDLEGAAVDRLAARFGLDRHDGGLVEGRGGVLFTIEGGLDIIDLVLMLGGEGIYALPLSDRKSVV